jgi:hypothetical protein
MRPKYSRTAGRCYSPRQLPDLDEQWLVSSARHTAICATLKPVQMALIGVGSVHRGAAPSAEGVVIRRRAAINTIWAGHSTVATCALLPKMDPATNRITRFRELMRVVIHSV